MKRWLVEPTRAWERCAWLYKCAGANAIQQHWSAYALWCDELWHALDLLELDLLELDCKHPCDGCWLTRSSYPGVRRWGGGMTASFDPRDVNLSTAFHEAGHAWEYIYTQWRPPGPLVTAAGPIAQAHWMAEKRPASPIMFDSALAYIINNGGRIDWQRSTEVFANRHQVALLRSQITRDWAFIEALAAKLMVVGTMTGAEVCELLLLRFMGVTS